MAFCSSCGAYIPDGQSACLACGFDEQAEAAKKKASGSSAAARRQQEQSEDMRELLEKHRAQQQEKNRRWAEQEQQRRRQQEQNRQWAEEEYARRMEERERQAQSYVNRSSSADYRSGGYSAAGGGNKALACLSYLGILFALPYLFTPQDRFARFHARQGLKLFAFAVLADLFGGLTGFGWILSLLRLYLIYKGISNASQGRTEPLPYIGTIGDKT